MSTIVGESGWERKALDAYWTEKWCTKWLLDELEPWMLALMKDCVVWEPACGAGWMSDVLLENGFDVLSTDIKDHGYAGMHGVKDFLEVEDCDPAIRCIFMNPPYDIKDVEGVPDITAEQFVRRALQLMKPMCGFVVAILRNEFDSASGRADLFGECPAYYGKYVLTKRPRWVVGSTGSPRHNYSWFVWSWDHGGDPVVRYLYPPKKGAAA